MIFATISSPPEDAFLLKKNAKSHTHYQNITQNIQFLAICHGTEIWKNDLKQSQKTTAALHWYKPS